MKKLTIFVLMIIGAFQLNAQDAISKFFSEYEDDDRFTQIVITSRMFGLFSDLDLEDEDDKEVAETISNLESLKVLTLDETIEGKELFKKAIKLVPSSDYEVLMTVRGQDENLQFFIKEKDKLIEELILVMGSENEFFIMSLVGKIDLKQVSKMASAMDIDGLEQLERLDDN